MEVKGRSKNKFHLRIKGRKTSERIALQATLQSSGEEELEDEEDEDAEKLPMKRGKKRKADNKKQTKKKSDVSKAKEAVKRGRITVT